MRINKSKATVLGNDLTSAWVVTHESYITRAPSSLDLQSLLYSSIPFPDHVQLGVQGRGVGGISDKSQEGVSGGNENTTTRRGREKGARPLSTDILPPMDSIQTNAIH